MHPRTNVAVFIRIEQQASECLCRFTTGKTTDGNATPRLVCITSHASQCRTVDHVVVLPDGADAKSWYVDCLI